MVNLKAIAHLFVFAWSAGQSTQPDCSGFLVLVPSIDEERLHCMISCVG